MTDLERRRRVEDLCDAALNRDPRERVAFVVAACGGDEALRQEVEALLAHAQTAEGFLAAPVGAVAAEVLGEKHGASLVGRQVGAYRIVLHLGTGGMGEVYRARDTTLGRDVAIKVVSQAFTSDPERRARFEREARMLAALNHPHIGAIYGLEDGDGIRALVLELVEGETLAEQLAAGRLPITRALGFARQIAEALEAAHERGIVHRDLKPANVKITPDGAVKVLDFGLAKTTSGDASGPDLTQAPTVTIGGTQEGMILGTAAYMSPEQARGKPVDKRTDIWAFGCVLFEMITGRRAFEGDDVSDTVAAILRSEPDWSALPVDMPAAVHRLLRRCLQKDRSDRLADISDARLEIEDALADGATTPASATVIPGRKGRQRLTWSLAAALVIALAGVLTLGARGYFQQAPADTRVYRSTLLLPVNATLSDALAPARRIALSPDGRRLAFTAAGPDGRPSLWVRSLDGLNAQSLAGTEDALAPFWSPDSRSLGFFTEADGKLKKIDAGGGAPVTVCDWHSPYVAGNAPGPTGATWNRDDVILFSTTGAGAGGIRRVSASGGTPSSLTTPDAASEEAEHWYPFFLPDGKHFLYLAMSEAGRRPLGIYLASLDSNARKLLVRGGSNAKFAQGHLLFLHETTLMAQALDLGRLELRGDAVPIAQSVQLGGAAKADLALTGAFTVSDTGVLAYQAGSTEVMSRLVWFDRTGKQIASLGDDADYGDVSLSPDSTRLAVSLFDPARRSRDIWLYDLARGLRTRLTFDPADDVVSMWSPDGSRIVFNSNRKGRLDLYEKASNGAGTDAVFLEEGNFDKYPYGWTPDGRFFLYASGNTTPGTGNDLYVLPLFGDRKAFVFLKTQYNEGFARLSPDGRWIAYISNDSGRNEIYVATFPQAGGKWQISSAGGTWPRWRRDGREIFFVASDNKLMAAEVDGHTRNFEVGAVRPLFQTNVRVDRRYGYDVSGDGQRFILNTVSAQASSTPVTLIVNWRALLKK